MKHPTRTTLGIGLALCVAFYAAAQRPEPNYDESLVPDFALPDLLTFVSGEPVDSASSWRERRRPELLRLFERHVYGRTPAGPFPLRFVVRNESADALFGTATRKEVRIFFTADDEGPFVDLLLYLPRQSRGPVPTFLGLNFYGNHSIHADPEISLSRRWMRQTDDYGIVDNRATEKSRGVRAHRWAVSRILERGYGLATLYYGDIDPDFDDGFDNGVHPLFDRDGRDPESWGSIGAWSWGLSRVMDYLETDDSIDRERVIVFGHSRLGKTSLWAGAQDERFAMVVSNDSGCGGAALSRRRFGETVRVINQQFPHWFSESFRQYDDNENQLPVDQHMLLALVAPRPVYVASAVEDQWADPHGEFLSAFHAGPAYELLGESPLPASKMPGVEAPAIGTIGYHVRRGGHDVTDYDWERFMDFADRHLPQK